MVVPADRRGEIVELVRTAAESFVPGDPFHPSTKLGPVVSAAQRDSMRRFIEFGVESGATLVTGGAEAPAMSRRASSCARGCSPTWIRTR